MDDIATYLGPKGYSIKKQYISIEEQHQIRKELNVMPFVPKSSISKPHPFPVYRESPKKIYVPRFYGLETYGEPDDITISEGDNIDIEFIGDLRFTGEVKAPISFSVVLNISKPPIPM